MNRRGFIALITSTLTGLLAACRSRGVAVTPRETRWAVASPASRPPRPPSSTPPPTPTPTPAPAVASVWIDPALPSDLAEAARGALADLQQRAGARNLLVGTISDEQDADLRLSARPLDAGSAVAIARTPLVLATSPRVPLRSVTGAQAASILAGKVANWSEVGSPKSIPLTLLGSVGDAALPVQSQPVSYDALLARFKTDPGAVALIPAAEIDFRAAALVIDGTDILAEAEKAGSYPFTLPLYLEVAPGATTASRDLVSPDSAGTTTANSAPLVADGRGVASTVTIVGDIILGRTVNTIMTRLNDFAAPFRLVADELKRADLTIGNLECSLSDGIAPPTDPYTFLFITRTAGVEGLKLSGIDGVSQANNHSMNFGAEGMHDTLAALDKAGIKHFGIGDNLAEARQPGLFEVNGLRLAFIGFDGITGDSYGATQDSPGTSPLAVENLVADIKAARQQADLVIPFIHWGVEYTLVPTDQQRAIARQAIGAGADLVVGSHPHWVQGVEIYQGKPVIYSLANFVFDQDWSEETKQGLIMHLTFHGTTLVALRFVPVYIEDFYQPHLVDGSELVTILDRVWSSTDQIAAEGAP